MASDTKIVALDEVGDLAAPPGSRAWAIAVRDKLIDLLRDAEFSSSTARFWFHALEDKEGWKYLLDANEKPFRSFESFCTYRKPFGLGFPREYIEQIIREREVKEAARLAEEAQPPRDDGRPPKSETYSLRKLSTGANDRRVAQIAKRRPDVLERMKQGEFKSVRAAAIEAGIVKRVTALQQLRRWWQKASARERTAFLRGLKRERPAV